MIRKTEEYFENTDQRYRLPRTSTMEKLALRVTAGEGAVLRYDDRVLVTDHTWGGFIAAVYEFVDDETEFHYSECRLNLIAMSDDAFTDGGHAIAWAMRKIADDFS